MQPQRIPCPENLLRVCENPFEDVHHIRPRRLLGQAATEGYDQSYRAKLKKVIDHPCNKRIVCRCIHAKLGDRLTEDILPVEPELDNLIDIWGPPDG